MKTAVEYYNQEIKELFNMHQDGEISGKMFHMSRLVALTKAKEMEKEQIIDAYYQGDADSDNIHVDAEQYYKENFKSEIMTAKEEAKKIYERFLNISHDMSPEYARRSAIEAVDLMSSVCNLLYIDYYLDIKEELESGDCI
jgi:vacuolar-type H+-ATPase subunit H